MYNGLYNKSVYWDDAISDLINAKLSLKYFVVCSHHAQNRINENNLSSNIYKVALYGEVVECEFINGKINKIITRVPHRNRPCDICSVILFKEDNVALVKTIWLNNMWDNHDTIRKENYIRLDK